MFRSIITATAMLAVTSLAIAVDEGKPTFVDKKDAGADFEFQGEYEGELRANGSKWGAQIIAMGQGKFKAIGFRGGLPGNGWEGEAGKYVEGKVEDGIVKIEAANFRLEADGKILKVQTKDGGERGQLKKVVRTSPTLGKKPPQGALTLFDGTSVDLWEKAELVDKQFLGATNCSTKETFGDHTLHVEFRTPFMPEHTGQERGNSGVYVQSRYEVQVLDSFGLEGKDNECGGIYQISKPKTNMCFPPLSWQTYDIDFVAAKYDADGKKTNAAQITVKHNGVVIHDKLELPKHTPGKDEEGPQPAGLFLQNHSNPVVFQNIWAIKN